MFENRFLHIFAKVFHEFKDMCKAKKSKLLKFHRF